jgi:hypothetical protein
MRLMGWKDRSMLDRYAADMQVQRAIEAKRRRAGPCVMAAQCRHLAAACAWPNVTIQLVPGILHAGLLGSITLADDGAALMETPAGGHVYTDDQSVRALTRRFDTIRSEALPASQSARRLTEMAHELAEGYL